MINDIKLIRIDFVLYHVVMFFVVNDVIIDYYFKQDIRKNFEGNAWRI